MSERRRPVLSLNLRSAAGSHRVEFFAAADWAGEAGRRPGPGLFRIRLDGRWFCPESRAKRLTRKAKKADAPQEFWTCTFAAAWGYLAETLPELATALDVAPPAVDPTLPAGTLVHLLDVRGELRSTRTRTSPFQDAAGNWRVSVFFGSDYPDDPAYLDQVRLVRG